MIKKKYLSKVMFLQQYLHMKIILIGVVMYAWQKIKAHKKYILGVVYIDIVKN